MIDPDSFAVRPAVAADAATLVAQTEALAAFHGKPGAATVTAADVLRDGFGPHPLIWFWLAEERATGRAVGYIQLCQGYAAWLGRPTLVVNNLFVDESVRGAGLGRRLMAAAAGFARGRGIERMELHVVDWNPARQFYEAMGFQVMKDYRCRIERAALDRLAAGTQA
ncbi:N-acetyltransferase [Allostella sp. ATCC 35155]|nr:N-acetyltransferase [Stella sp. ATCC 35155]